MTLEQQVGQGGSQLEEVCGHQSVERRHPRRETVADGDDGVTQKPEIKLRAEA